MEAQVSLIAAFRSSALLGLVSHLPLDNTPYILYGRGHQVRSWRAGVPAEFSSNPNQTHPKQLIKVLGILETSRQVC